MLVQPVAGHRPIALLSVVQANLAAILSHVSQTSAAAFQGTSALLTERQVRLAVMLSLVSPVLAAVLQAVDALHLARKANTAEMACHAWQG